MDPVVALKLIELAITGIQGAFSLLEMAGKTAEEIDQIYAEEKAKFMVNRPENLPDV
jgi:hypothetical protein